MFTLLMITQIKNNQPETIANSEKIPTYVELMVQNDELLAQNAALLEQVHQMRVEIQTLRDEVARLKGQKAKPQIGPSRLMQRDKKKRRKNHKGLKMVPVEIDKTVVVKAENVPEGSRFKGYEDFTVQDLVIKSETTKYRFEKWLTPQGNYIIGKLPGDKALAHFGNTLQAFVLYQYYHAQVTEPLIVEQLKEWGVRISSGQVHRIITEGKEKFHKEKDEILRVGLQVSGHVHVDDTGARHKGKNGYCTHIGNKWFAWFKSTESKSRINFLELLRAGFCDYVVSGEALEYMAAQKMPKQELSKLSLLCERSFSDKIKWQLILKQLGITQDNHVRIATEGALLGSALAHGLNPKLAIISDDAGQFKVLLHALCWIHAERLFAKLIGFSKAQKDALEEIRTAVWKLYADLKAYQIKPTDKVKAKLEQRFDSLCKTNTCFASLNEALKRMHKNKAELLLALERPELPLHNNLSEGDIREYVKRRKISGGTRSENGRLCRDTFASLKKTCRKLGVSFWNYLKDRIGATNGIPLLPSLIEARARST